VYGPDFFAKHHAGAERSARSVLPLVLELVEPGSVIDVGCGSGAWLAEAERLGVSDYLGVDGFTPAGSLAIPAERFRTHDLATPLRLDRRFDLVISLEVAEHVEERAAATLVESLVSLGPVVLFSAAVPDQGGDGHLNEQFPDYWVRLFGEHGFVAVDALRPALWGDDDVAWWYRQNMLLMCEREAVAGRPRLRDLHESTRREQLAVIHPYLYLSRTHEWRRARDEVARERSFREVLGMARPAAAEAVRRRLRRRN
jgi:SAM-dependent methyltransferase